MSSWEPIWNTKLTQSVSVYNFGRKLAEYGDLQRLVFDVLQANCPSLNENTVILEVGCGSGPVAEMLRSYSSQVFGVDLSLSALKLTNQRGVIGAVADARELPFKENHFNLVYSTGMIDLLDDTDAAFAIREIVRVTAPGNRIVIITAWSGCFFHESIKKFLMKRGSWRYGPKRTFKTLKHLLPENAVLHEEKSIGAIFQFRFISYLFENCSILRKVYHLLFLLASVVLRPLNRLPGALLVSIVEKNE